MGQAGLGKVGDFDHFLCAVLTETGGFKTGKSFLNIQRIGLGIRIARFPVNLSAGRFLFPFPHPVNPVKKHPISLTLERGAGRGRRV